MRERVCERFAEADWVVFAWVGAYDASEGCVRPVAASGIPMDEVGAVSLSSDAPRERVIGRALDTRAVQVEQDLQDDPPSEDWGEHADAHGYQSVAVVPLGTEDEVDSVLYLAASQPGCFDADERALLGSLGETIGFALHDAEPNAGAGGSDAEASEAADDTTGGIDVVDAGIDEGFAALGMSQDVTERKQRDRDLERYETVAETASEVIVSIDERSRIQSVNPAVEDVFGYEPDELVGESITTLMPESLTDQHREALQRYIRTGERTLDWDYVELLGEHENGHEIPIAVSFSEYEHDGEQFFTGIIRDVTERKQFERAITTLHEASRDLIRAETKSEVSRRTVDAASEVLDTEGVSVYLFDDEENALRPAASTDYLDDTFGGGLPTFTPEDTAITWEAFIDGETLTHADVLESGDVYRRDTPLRSGIWIPLSDHGVLSILSEDVDGFDEQTERLADHVAATAEATLDRVERGEAVREQEQELERRNRQLKSLNQTNEILRGIDRALVEATTRESIEQAVCGLLTGDDRFAFAWIGDSDGETVTPQTWAGDDRGYLDAVPLRTGGSGDPAVETAATGDTTVVSNVASNLRDAPWRKAALERNFQSAVSIPLQYNEMEYGVLTVYDTEPNAFDDLSEGILRELGETIANAMNFVDTRRALLSDSVVELELVLEDPDDPLVAVAREAGCEFEFQGVVHQSAGAARVFVTSSGADVDAVRAAVSESARIEDVTVFEEEADGEHRFELEVAGATIPTTVVECGGVAQTIEIGEEVRVVVELPQSTGVRTFVDRLEDQYPGTELVARRDRERTDRPQQAFETSLTERLTTRQLEALQTAYLSGYFEWPRDRTGEEVAEALDITQPTFNGHLRAAERKLCAALFDGQQASTD